MSDGGINYEMMVKDADHCQKPNAAFVDSLSKLLGLFLWAVGGSQPNENTEYV